MRGKNGTSSWRIFKNWQGSFEEILWEEWNFREKEESKWKRRKLNDLHIHVIAKQLTLQLPHLRIWNSQTTFSPVWFWEPFGNEEEEYRSTFTVMRKENSTIHYLLIWYGSWNLSPKCEIDETFGTKRKWRGIQKLPQWVEEKLSNFPFEHLRKLIVSNLVQIVLYRPCCPSASCRWQRESVRVREMSDMKR
jgi:hypothetical protein